MEEETSSCPIGLRNVEYSSIQESLTSEEVVARIKVPRRAYVFRCMIEYRVLPRPMDCQVLANTFHHRLMSLRDYHRGPHFRQQSREFLHVIQSQHRASKRYLGTSQNVTSIQ